MNDYKETIKVCGTCHFPKDVCDCPTPPVLTREQYEILHHTEHRAAGGVYCGGGPAMDALIALGLMEYAGRKSFVPEPYYRITGAGRAAVSSKRSFL